MQLDTRRLRSVLARILLILLSAPSVQAQVRAHPKSAQSAESEQSTLGTQSSAPKGTRVATKIGYYRDDDGLDVVTPIVSFTQKIYDTTTLGFIYDADTFTAATVDVRTHASKSFSETRHGFGFWGTHRLIDKQLDLSGNLDLSFERDYASMTLGAGFSKDLLNKNLTLAGGYSYVANAIGRAGTPIQNYLDTLNIHAFNASFTQLLSKYTFINLSGSFIFNDGYQASVYRYVPLFLVGNVEEKDINETNLLAGIVQPVMRPAERLPKQRSRWAVVARVNHYLPWMMSVAADYRYYTDTWSLKSNTLSLKLYIELPHDFEVRLRNRLYGQSAAKYYQRTYVLDSPDSLPEYYTMDRELGTFSYFMPGIKLSKDFVDIENIEVLTIDWKIDAQYTRYEDFVFLENRLAWIFQFGVSVGL